MSRIFPPPLSRRIGGGLRSTHCMWVGLWLCTLVGGGGNICLRPLPTRLSGDLQARRPHEGAQRMFQPLVVEGAIKRARMGLSKFRSHIGPTNQGQELSLCLSLSLTARARLMPSKRSLWIRGGGIKKTSAFGWRERERERERERSCACCPTRMYYTICTVHCTYYGMYFLLL